MRGLGGGGGSGQLGAKRDVLFNPLTPKRVWHLTSPYRITAEPNMRNMGNNHQVMKLLIVK